MKLILWIDDDLGSSKKIRFDITERLPIHIELASSFETAAKKLNDMVFDLVITDLVFPLFDPEKFSGLRFAVAIRSEELSPWLSEAGLMSSDINHELIRAAAKVPILLYSALPSAAVSHLAEKTGAKDIYSHSKADWESVTEVITGILNL